MDFNLIKRLQKENQLAKLKETNDYTKKYGLSLSEKDMELILSERKEALKTQKRVEFGEGIVSKIIYEFCDSSFIEQSNYADTIMRLQVMAVVYCINEALNQEENAVAPAKKSEAVEVYNAGFKAVTDKVKRTVEIYNQVIKDFDDYDN